LVLLGCLVFGGELKSVVFVLQQPQALGKQLFGVVDYDHKDNGLWWFCTGSSFGAVALRLKFRVVLAVNVDFVTLQ
jgi:hypothetical protein